MYTHYVIIAIWWFTAKPYGEMWSAVSAEDRARHLFVVKVLFHGPFLFNQRTGLFDQVISLLFYYS